MLKRKLIVLIVLLSLFVGLGAFGWQQGKKIELPLMIRDLTIAYIAEKKAGENVPYEIDYAPSAVYTISLDPLNPEAPIILSNSLYLNELTRKIVPFFQYEGITENPIYPQVVYISPQLGQKSFHNLGEAWAQVVVRINERFILDEWRLDERQMISTLIHELGHIQGGNFLGGEPNWLTSDRYESNTQSATLEVLAAMCNYRNEVACKAFWDDIYAYARGSFRMRLRRWHLEQWYYPIADLLWWDDVDRQAADKSLRYWMNDQDRKDYLYTIIYNYQQRPWEYVVIPGLLGTPLDTGLDGKCEVGAKDIRCEPILMSFDDAEDLVGGFVLWLIRSLS